MGRLLDGLKDAEYNPHTAVCKLPQPFRMLDKLLSRLVDDAVNLAVERDEARLAARGIAEGTEVLAPSAVVDDIGAMTSVSTSRDGAWAFVGNEDGELVVVNVQRGSVASKTKVLAGSIAAVDAVAVDPPPQVTASAAPFGEKVTLTTALPTAASTGASPAATTVALSDLIHPVVQSTATTVISPSTPASATR